MKLLSIYFNHSVCCHRISDSVEFSLKNIGMYFWLNIYVALLVVTLTAGSDEHRTTLPNNNRNVFCATEYYNVSDKPVLANGHVGYVPFSDSIYMNGAFNGYKGRSHRARIPNYANIYIDSCGPSKTFDSRCTYALDVQRAVFEINTTFDNGNIIVKHSQYAHRYYGAAIINTIHIKRKTVNASGGSSET